MDRTAIAGLIDQYGPDVMRFCRSLTHCSCDAEDLYQQTFLKLLGMRVRLEKEKNERAFLFSIASGIWKNECRKLARRAQIAPPVSLEEPLDAAQQVDDRVVEQMRRQELLQAVAKLKEPFREAVILMYQFDMGIEEIAKIQKVPKGTVKSRLKRAREKLRKEMEARGYAQ